MCSLFSRISRLYCVQVLNLFFAGLFIPFDNLPSYWQWYSYIDFMRWAWGSLTVGTFSRNINININHRDLSTSRV